MLARTCARRGKPDGKTVLHKVAIALPRQGIGVRLRECDEGVPGPFRQPPPASAKQGTGQEIPKVMNTDGEACQQGVPPEGWGGWGGLGRGHGNAPGREGASLPPRPPHLKIQSPSCYPALMATLSLPRATDVDPGEQTTAIVSV